MLGNCIGSTSSTSFQPHPSKWELDLTFVRLVIFFLDIFLAGRVLADRRLWFQQILGFSDSAWCLWGLGVQFVLGLHLGLKRLKRALCTVTVGFDA